MAIDEDRFIAPLPDLVVLKNSAGVFYEMFNYYGEEFSRHFGLMFEKYVGVVLMHSVRTAKLISEDVIRQTYPPEKGKVPDWIIIEGDIAILIECKATRFSRAAIASGTEEHVKDSLKQVIKGLRQLASFREACMAKAPGLEVLHKCKIFKPLLTSLEPLYLINSTFFREFLDGELSSSMGVMNLPWYILSLDELERLQPYLAKGLGVGSLLNELQNQSCSDLIVKPEKQSGLTFKDSFLYEVSQDLYRRLGVPMP